jgi:hypothetical protein
MSTYRGLVISLGVRKVDNQSEFEIIFLQGVYEIGWCEPLLLWQPLTDTLTGEIECNNEHFAPVDLKFLLQHIHFLIPKINFNPINAVVIRDESEC